MILGQGGGFMTGEEFSAFLDTSGFREADVAALLAVDRVSVFRWKKGAHGIADSHARILRLLVKSKDLDAIRAAIQDYGPMYALYLLLQEHYETPEQRKRKPQTNVPA
jgi:hypothetical protein